jgi:hypothetical protein
MNAKRLFHLLLATAGAAAIAAPIASAANNRVQIAGRLVIPAQLSEAQLAAGHDPSTRLMQVGGSFIEPSQVSGFERSTRTKVAAADDGSSSNAGTTGIVAGGFAAALLLLGSSTLVIRRRRSVPAAA